MAIFEYIFIDHRGRPRGKTMVRPDLSTLKDVSQLDAWSFDGSSTEQATGDDSDVIIRPVSFCTDPFNTTEQNAYLVLCELYTPDGKPHPDNHRHWCDMVMRRASESKPWFGFEQEYTIHHLDGCPFNWESATDPGAGPQGPYYCSVGGRFSYGRALAVAHRDHCLKAGLAYCGMNAEVMPSQWEYQIGPCEGVNYGDQVWLSRYILYRLAEDSSILGEAVSISFDPKPLAEFNGNGGHTNFSTAEMRVTPGGLAAIEDACARIGERHADQMKLYGEGNEKRMTGVDETASYDDFSWGVADRGRSIRIPRHVADLKGGYLEDRRPAGNCDPYRVSRLLVEATLGLE